MIFNNDNSKINPMILKRNEIFTETRTTTKHNRKKNQINNIQPRETNLNSWNEFKIIDKKNKTYK